MSTETEEKAGASGYRNPVVDGFYSVVIGALEEADDGASAAARITGEFRTHYLAAERAREALASDVRRISGDDSAKACMLTHASRHSGRMLEESMRQAGRLHTYEEMEARLHDLAGQLDNVQPSVAMRIREVLADVPLTPPVPVAAGTVVIASQTDHRWTTGWFSDGSQGPLQPLPFVGWVLTAEAPSAPGQGVECAFLMGGSWYTKGELAERGLRFARLD